MLTSFLTSTVLLTISAAYGDPTNQFVTCPYWKPVDPDQAISAVDGTKVVLSDANKNDGAACLDGTPPVFYWRPATEASASKKFHVFFEGGGACSGDTTAYRSECFNTCEERAGTDLGSSKGYPTRSNYDDGYMSTDKNTNPLSYNWNTAYIKYCDGGVHSGGNMTTTKAGKYELHFRGVQNTRAVFEELIKSYKFGEATDVLVSGCSAGGVAVYAHAQMIADNYIPKGANFLTMPDSGFMPEVDGRGSPNFIDAVNWMFTNMNTSASMDPRCLKDHASDPMQCSFPEVEAPYIDVPMFALQARFDAWQTSCIIETANPNTINEYGANFTNTFMKTFINGGQYANQHGGFLDSCHHHCGEWNDIHVDKMDQSQAQLQFYSNHAAKDRHLWFQNETYPCTSCCHD